MLREGPCDPQNIGGRGVPVKRLARKARVCPQWAADSFASKCPRVGFQQGASLPAVPTAAVESVGEPCRVQVIPDAVMSLLKRCPYVTSAVQDARSADKVLVWAVENEVPPVRQNSHPIAQLGARRTDARLSDEPAAVRFKLIHERFRTSRIVLRNEGGDFDQVELAFGRELQTRHSALLPLTGGDLVDPPPQVLEYLAGRNARATFHASLHFGSQRLKLEGLRCV